MEVENATDIVKKHLDNYPNLHNFLKRLESTNVIETKKVGKEFDYPSEITKNYLYSHYGTFMDYFIRKLLSNQFQIELKDDVTELILKNASTYFVGKGKDINLKNDIEKHYAVFKDSKKQAMDILETIKKVSLSYKLSFLDPLPKADIETEPISLLEVKKYLQELPYESVEIKPSADCIYFKGNADLIFDQKVLYEIKTSKYINLGRNCENMKFINFYKLILYGFGYFKKTGQIIKCYKIYNPLLGYEHIINLKDLDMGLFEMALKKDLEKKTKK